MDGMTNSLNLKVTKPIAVWNQPLQANFKDFFKSLTKAVVNGALFNWGAAIENSIDALATFGLKNDPGQLTWLLIHRSFGEAIKNLIKENTDLIRSRYISHMPTPHAFSDWQSILHKHRLGNAPGLVLRFLSYGVVTYIVPTANKPYLTRQISKDLCFSEQISQTHI